MDVTTRSSSTPARKQSQKRSQALKQAQSRAQSRTPIRSWARRQRDLPRRLLDAVLTWFIADRHADYGFAVMRIASGSFLLGWLLINLPIASRIWGPGSGYWQPYREILGYGFPFNLLQSAGPGVFWLWYLVTIALVVAFLLGWRTRVVTPLLFIAYTALNGQNTPISDGGNYFIRIMLIYLILVDVSRRWSLDAKRRARKQAPESQTGSVLHNIGLCLVIAQVCTVYLEAGLYKVQGTLWQNGTAVYYPLQSVAYGVFPPLADLLTYFMLPVFIATYVTVLAQVAFPFLLFNTLTRRIVLVMLLGMHLSIAVAMGLPFFSGIMASADAVLVSGATWIAIVAWLRTALTQNRLARGLGEKVTAWRAARGAGTGSASSRTGESAQGRSTGSADAEAVEPAHDGADAPVDAWAAEPASDDADGEGAADSPAGAKAAKAAGVDPSAEASTEASTAASTEASDKARTEPSSEASAEKSSRGSSGRRSGRRAGTRPQNIGGAGTKA
ncbi:HTTM domain-containing protein [Brachybacterium tyrofermentans]|uniref:HTTM domain-containing protein n=1 Tax=Brachybacterium tyrofermentans TaxID=47848 RepID=UPI003F91371A